MADFLGRLAERALGVATVAQPAIAPRFAMGPRLTEEFVATTTEAPAVPTYRDPLTEGPRAARSPDIETQKVEVTVQKPPERLDERIPAPMPVHAEREAARIDDEPHRPPRSKIRSETPQPRVQSPEPQRQPEIALPAVLPEIRVEASSARTEPPPPAVEPKALRDPDFTRPEPKKHVEAEPVVPHPTMPPVLWREGPPGLNGRQSSRVQEPDAPAPTVRVSIGRIEVRAVFPEQPQRQPAPLPRNPALSLSEYLKQRDGGMR